MDVLVVVINVKDVIITALEVVDGVVLNACPVVLVPLCKKEKLKKVFSCQRQENYLDS